MNVKKKARRVMSGLLTAVTVLSTVLSPAVAYASDDAGSVKRSRIMRRSRISWMKMKW